jgi:glycosyltransferase involved in cell wall biosynthesis
VNENHHSQFNILNSSVECPLLMSEPLTLSIVTPSFNTAQFLGDAIQSVLAQDWPRVNFIVMDGGSTDGSVELLRSFGDRVQWVSQKDGGQSDALNQGFARLGGEILGWLNSDDTYAPGAFRAVMEYFQAHPEINVVYGNANFIDAAGNLIGPCVHIEPYNHRRLFYYTDFLVQPATFFRRSAFEAVGGIDDSLHFGMDYDLWLRLAKQFKFAYLPKLLANFRWLSNNKTAIGGFKRLEEIERILKKHGLPLPAYNRLERINLHLEAARAAMRNAAPTRALKSLASGTAELFRTPRAMASLFQPLTWKIIWTGQVLRKRAVRKNER